jgi:hypothetical protein
MAYLVDEIRIVTDEVESADKAHSTDGTYNLVTEYLNIYNRSMVHYDNLPRVGIPSTGSFPYGKDRVIAPLRGQRDDNGWVRFTKKQFTEWLYKDKGVVPRDVFAELARSTGYNSKVQTQLMRPLNDGHERSWCVEFNLKNIEGASDD